MRPGVTHLLFLALAACVLHSAPGAALTIYRIGNPDISPPPEAGAAGVTLKYRTWEEASEGAGGMWEGLTLEDGRMLPIRIGPDDNLSLTSAARDGGARGIKYPDSEPQTEPTDWAIDGDTATSFNLENAVQGALANILIVYLGSRFPVNRVVFYPSPQSARLVTETLELVASDSQGGSDVLLTTANNTRPTVDLRFPSRLVDRLQLYVTNLRWFGPVYWEVAEFEVYGEGYVAEAIHQSLVFDLEAPATLGPLRWSGFKDRDGQLNIRTRSGADEDPNRYWRYTGRGDEISFLTPDGVPLTREDYDNLKGGQPEITADLDSWSTWSGPYDFGSGSGTPISSPGPQRFLQLQTEFVPKGLHGGGLDFLEFRTSQPPVSGRIAGEVSPGRVPAGAVASFVYAMLPTLTGDTSGFDRLILETTGRFVAVDSVRVNEEWTDAPAEVTEDRVALTLPRMEAVDNRKLVEIFFEAEVFHYGTSFVGRVFDSERPLEVGQPVEAGDASFRLDSNRLWVGVGLDGEIVQDVDAQPRVLTPNGDHTNDEVEIVYTLLKLVGEGAVEVGIFDLSGRQVRQLYRGAQNSGRYAWTWDGRSEDGALVPPGTYLFQVLVDPDEGQTRTSGLISVAY